VFSPSFGWVGWCGVVVVDVVVVVVVVGVGIGVGGAVDTVGVWEAI